MCSTRCFWFEVLAESKLIVESFKETQDREYEKAVDNLAKKFDSKLDKVYEHHRSMQKNYEEK